MQTLLKRSGACFRPLFLDGKQIDNIIFYKDGKEVFKSGCGWLVNKGVDVEQLTIEGNIPRSTKLNLNRTDNFYMKGCREYSFDKAILLYLHIDSVNIDVQEVGKPYVDYETETETIFKQDYKIKVGSLVVVEARRHHTEYKPLHHQIREIKKTVEEKQRTKISVYDLENILKHYTIKPKKAVKN